MAIIPRWHRRQIYLRDGKKCLKCGSKQNLTMDHVIPLSRGGKNELHNYQTLCESCNHEKADQIIDYRGRGIQDNDVTIDKIKERITQINKYQELKYKTKFR